MHTISKKITAKMNFYFFQFGFKGISGFLQSILTPDFLAYAAKIAAFFGLITTGIEYYVGLPKGLFIAFVLLFAVDFLTGLQAAHAQGFIIKSKKIPRIVIKIITYLVILTIVNSLHAEDTALKLLYSWTFWTVFHVIVLQNIRSIFENLHNSGYKSASLIHKMLNNKYVKQFEMFTGENPDKLEEDKTLEKE